MITKIFKYESEHMVYAIHLPKEYGFYQLVGNMCHHSMLTNIDDYIETLKQQFKVDKEPQFLIVVKQIFNKEYWVEYYKNKEKTDLCPTCSQHLPVGYYDNIILAGENAAKTAWGFKVIDEKHIKEVLERSAKLMGTENDFDISPVNYPTNLPKEIIDVTE